MLDSTSSRLTAVELKNSFVKSKPTQPLVRMIFQHSFLKKLANYIAPNLTQIYNSSICNGIFPYQWKKANVVAIYKSKGSKAEVENYRPISVLPILGRVLEKAVCTQLQQFCDANGIIPLQQLRFRK